MLAVDVVPLPTLGTLAGSVILVFQYYFRTTGTFTYSRFCVSMSGYFETGGFFREIFGMFKTPTIILLALRTKLFKVHFPLKVAGENKPTIFVMRIDE
jgi:hypothetical protein